jgi:HSP20 family protein
MKTSRYYEPWNTLNQMYKDMENLYSQTGQLSGYEDSTIATSTWVPSVDIKEEEDRFVIHADIPGVDPKEIEITMENGVLTIKGERVSETKEERKNYKRIERVRGAFYRRFSLPDTADADKITAVGRHGVLEVMIPKREIAQPRKINVDVVNP